MTKLGDSALQSRRNTSMKAESATPANQQHRPAGPVICTMHIKDMLLLLRDLRKARHLPLPREPSHKNATRPDKPFNRYLSGMGGGATKFSTNVIGTKLHQRCSPQVCMHACMHATGFQSTTGYALKKKNLQAAFFFLPQLL